MKKAIQFAGTLMTLLFYLNGLAQSVPQLINYQGQLLDASGNPMPTGDYTIEVRLFPVDSGGAPLWGPQVFNGQSGTGFGPKVAVVQGRFNLVLGPQDTSGQNLLNAFSANPSVFIELKVGTASPISPRQQILAAPYALKADSFGGFGWDAVFTDTGRPDTGHIPGSRIADAAITTSNLADGAVTSLKLADGAVTTTKIASNAVGTLQVTNGAITPAKLNLQTGNIAIGQASGSYTLDLVGTTRLRNTGAGTLVLLSDGSSYAIYAVGNMQLYGNLNINGTLSKSAGSFRIDHPLDPANKFLYHSFVESPDMKNIYDGLAVLDNNGEARVELPNWFEALNKDFRYQLTAIGAPGPNLFIAEEINNNRFKIAGGIRGLKVSWQVTGIRHDAYANAHRIPVEEDKPAALQGYYLHPEEHRMPETKNVRSVLHPQAELLQK